MIYLKHLLAATQGTLQQSRSQDHFSGFSHDTQQLQPGEIFVAARGVRRDGHDYLYDAVARGATALLLNNSTFQKLPELTREQLQKADLTIVLVEDTRLALQAYARFILALWKPTVIAVTGSVGKTTTKEAIATVLSERYPTFRSLHNYNDLLGLPLSLGRLEASHAYAVLELGGDYPGEITELARLIQPQIVAITNISPIQLRYFNNLERLTEEFATLIQNLPPEGCCFFPLDANFPPHLLPGSAICTTQHRSIPIHTQQTILPFILPQRVDWQGVSGLLMQADEKPLQLAAPLLGLHSLHTLALTYQVAKHLGMKAEEIQIGLAKIQPLPGRLFPLTGLSQSRLLDDTHNSAPASLLAGLQTLQTLTPANGQRIAVLGDMLNLGSYSEKAHALIGSQLPKYADHLVARGEFAPVLAEAAKNAGFDAQKITITSTHEDAAKIVRQLLITNPQGQKVVLLKGSEGARMERVTEALLKHSWQASERLVRQTPGWKKTTFRQADRPTWIEVDLNAIGNNTRQLKAIVGPQVKLLVALKADAYGHGAVNVARTVLHNGATMLGVATVSEAIPLRHKGIMDPILVFGYIPRWQMREAVRLQVTSTLYDIELARELSRTAQELERTVQVHVKIDTGMSRLGIRFDQPDDIIALIKEIQTLPGLELEGMYTHFANADETDQTYALKQLTRFQELLNILDREGLRPRLIHAANSAGLFSLPEARFDMVRPGVAVYGLHPSPTIQLPAQFRPALSFKTQVSQVKEVPAGEGVSYGITYITTRPTRIAVLPVGYADGFRRGPTNWGHVLIHGQAAPILGRVCMDQCMVDVTHIPQTRIGDEVVLIGHQGTASLSAEEVAQKLGTLNYEVVSEILARVPRVD